MVIRRTLVMLGLAGLIVTLVPTAAHAAPESAPVWSLSTGATVGNASLLRSDGGISFRVTTNGLVGGNAYSLWFVVFTNPEACDGGCGADDLFRADVGGVALWGAGHVIGESGNGSFSGRRATGSSADSDFGEFGPGSLSDPWGSEIHLVVRTHGPVIPDLVDEQIHSFNVGCRAGEPNVGQCANAQAAIFV